MMYFLLCTMPMQHPCIQSSAYLNPVPKLMRWRGPVLYLTALSSATRNGVGGREGGSIGGGAPLGQELPQVDTKEAVDV